MKFYQAASIVVALLLITTKSSECRRRKYKGDEHDKAEARKTKTKTKWSTSTDLGGVNTQVSTEEHGYYVKRTYSPSVSGEKKQQSPPFLAIPIAWFSCEGKTNCQTFSNSATINSAAHALSEGYLCDDDCEGPYEPICGETSSEVAVFYNKCKLNVAKCRTHGLWVDLPYDKCQQNYPQETTYTDKKFKASPYFKEASMTSNGSSNSSSLINGESQQIMDKNKESVSTSTPEPEKKSTVQPQPLEVAMQSALDEINAKLSEAEKVVADQDKLKYLVA